MTDVWGNVTDGILQYSMEAFSVLDPYLYPLLFLGIIGYIYTAMQSMTSAIVAILITLGVFVISTNIYNEAGDLLLFLYIITILGITFLVVNLFIRRFK